MSIDELQMMIKTLRIEPPTNVLNKRHLIRAIEQKGINSRGMRKPDPTTVVVAITTDMISLNERITARAEEMFARGVLREAADLGEKYGWESEAMTGNIYPILRQVLDGGISQEEAIRQFVTRDRQLVKRQLTWLRRHDYVEWYELAQARSYLEGILDRWRRENVLP